MENWGNALQRDIVSLFHKHLFVKDPTPHCCCNGKSNKNLLQNLIAESILQNSI